MIDVFNVLIIILKIFNIKKVWILFKLYTLKNISSNIINLVLKVFCLADFGPVEVISK